MTDTNAGVSVTAPEQECRRCLDLLRVSGGMSFEGHWYCPHCHFIVAQAVSEERQRILARVATEREAVEAAWETAFREDSKRRSSEAALGFRAVEPPSLPQSFRERCKQIQWLLLWIGLAADGILLLYLFLAH